MFLNAKARQRVAGVPRVVATAVAQSQAQRYTEVFLVLVSTSLDSEF